MRRRFDELAGQVLLRLAMLLELKVAGEDAADRWLTRRNAAIRGANRRGIPVEVLAARLGLTPSWIRQKIADGKEPAVDTAA
ncbi:hypothetical protein ACFXI6_14420 [Streptomyces mirabilis]|uniref:hypothetical protein n=1 Tax=Streptomyces mirabilis TaxID=68239 RepID=UPI0036B7D5BD